MFHSRVSLHHGITVSISIHLVALFICDLFVWISYSIQYITIGASCWTLVSLHLDIFQVIGGQLRCLMGKWWNNCTQYHNHQYHPVPPSTTMYCFLLHWNAHPSHCFELFCNANLTLTLWRVIFLCCTSVNCIVLYHLRCIIVLGCIVLLFVQLCSNRSLFHSSTRLINKLAKARKMRKPPGTLGLKKFGPGKLWVKKVWAQNVEQVEEKQRV